MLFGLVINCSAWKLLHDHPGHMSAIHDTGIAYYLLIEYTRVYQGEM